MNLEPVLAFALLIAACTDATNDASTDDPIDESFLDSEGEGKDDAYGIGERSPEGLGILQLVNTANWHDLEAVGLGANAFNELWTYRDGADNRAYSDDDNLFNDLKELDDRPYIGRGAFTKLLAYAEAHGYVSPNAFETPCNGAPITLARLQEVTANGSAKFPTGATWVRTRKCNGALGCSPWSVASKVGEPRDTTFEARSPSATEVGFLATLNSRVSRPQPQGYSLDAITSYRWQFTTPAPALAPLPALTGYYHHSYGSNVGSSGRMVDSALTFTDSCVRITGRVISLDASYSPNGHEREVAFLVEY